MELEAERKILVDGLPHLYGWKWYQWAWDFFNSKNKMNLLCSANQISKSSTQIRKAIHWATDTSLWKELWTTPPKQFWYLYPSKDIATIEFEKKWVPEFLPKGKFKDDPKYGWDIEYEKKEIEALHFKTGVTIYFKSYAQGANKLQTATLHAVFADEEVPEDIFQELMFRLAATDGYFHSVFTATLGQDMWRRAMEGVGDSELFPHAFKRQVSMYDCILYKDNTPSQWTESRIQQIVMTCKSKEEVERRVMGRFITPSGRSYPAFDGAKHYMQPEQLPEGWVVYSGIDMGTGGTNHPAAMCFVGVSPDHTEAWVIRGWRGCDGVVRHSGEVLEKYREVRAGLMPVMQSYDSHAKDFGIIAERAHESFVKADKARDLGEDVVNSLFKHGMLKIFDTPELRKLGSELTMLMKDTAKTSARDDFVDALRYAVVRVPWNWTAIAAPDEVVEDVNRPMTELEYVAQEIRIRRGESLLKKAEGWDDLFDDIEEWNEAYG